MGLFSLGKDRAKQEAQVASVEARRENSRRGGILETLEVIRAISEMEDAKRLRIIAELKMQQEQLDQAAEEAAEEAVEETRAALGAQGNTALPGAPSVLQLPSDATPAEAAQFKLLDIASRYLENKLAPVVLRTESGKPLGQDQLGQALGMLGVRPEELDFSKVTPAHIAQLKGILSQLKR